MSGFVRLTPGPNNGHVEQLRLQFTFLVLQESLLSTLLADLIQAPPECEVTEVFVLATGVIALVMEVATLTKGAIQKKKPSDF